MKDYKNYSSIELAYLILVTGAVGAGEIRAELYARDAELTALRAQLERARPLLDAARRYDSAWSGHLELVNLTGAAIIYARAVNAAADEL